MFGTRAPGLVSRINSAIGFIAILNTKWLVAVPPRVCFYAQKDTLYTVLYTSCAAHDILLDNILYL